MMSERMGRLRCAAYRAAAEAALLLIAALGLAASSSQAAAQASRNYVAYVESVSGRALASSDGAQGELDVLDPIHDGTQLSLAPDAQLRICHYRTHNILTLKGPLQATISADGVTAGTGNAVAASKERCAAPVMSTVQGGFALRGVGRATNVALQPKIRIVNRTTQKIRKATLWDGTQGAIVAAFDGNVAQPQLAEGQTYALVIEFADRSEWKMMLRATAAAEASAVIVSVR